MKTHFIFLCLIVSGGFVHATTQTKADPDKPARLYVKTYTDTEDGSQASTDTYQDASGNATGEWDSYVETGNTSGSWSDNGGGSSSWTWQGIYAASHVPIGTNYAWYDVVYQTNAYPDIGVASVNASDDDLDTPFTVNMEHCDLDVPLIDTSGSYLQNMGGGNFDYQTEKDTGSRHAQATMILQTGGKAVSRQENLFCLGATAAQILCVKTPIPVWANPPPPAVPPVLPQNIQIMGESLDTNGNLYVVLPDNDTLDVTPQLQGVDYYTFTENQQKYTLTLTAKGISLSNSVVAANANFCVGQNVPFALSLPAGVTATNYQWTLGGTYVNKWTPAPNTNSSDIYTNDPTLLTNPTLQTNWWVSGGFNPPLTYTALVSCTLLFTNGNPPQPCTTQGLFTMQRPQVAMLNPAYHGTPTNLWVSSTTLWVTLGRGTIALGVESTTNNMSYYIGVTSLNFAGDAKITQICTINATGSGLNNCTNWLDNSDPYSSSTSVRVNANVIATNQFGLNTMNLDDAPQAASSLYQAIQMNDSFVDYVMFNPDYSGSGSIYVPLGEITWSTTAGVSWSSTTISPNSVGGPTNPDNSQNWPVWTSVYSNR